MPQGIRQGTFLPAQLGAQERRGGLDAGVEDAPDVGGVVEPEHRLGGREGDPLGHLQRQGIEVMDVLGVHQDLGDLGVEAQGDDVQQVLVGHVPGVLELEIVVEQELLVVGELEVQRHVEGVLQVLGEHPGHEVAEVGVARRPATGVEVERLPGLVAVQYPFHVPVGVHHAPLQQGVQLSVLGQSVQ